MLLNMSKPRSRNLFFIVLIFLIISGCKDNPAIADFGLKSTNQLTYHKWINENWEIYLNSVKGDNPINISNFKYEDSDNTWSSDGKYIAYSHFQRDFGRQSDITVYNTETGETKNLTPGDEYIAQAPKWTPDGKSIYFWYHKIPELTCLYIVNADNADKKKLLDSQADIFFYPDSYNFLYVPSTPESMNHILYKTNIDKTYNEQVLDLYTIADAAAICGFNADKNELFIIAHNQPSQYNFLLRYNLNTSKIDTLVKSGNDNKIMYMRNSNDFSKVVYCEFTNDYKSEKLFIYNLIDKQKTFLVEIPASEGVLDFRPPVFSPKDKYIAYVKNVYQSGQWFAWKSYLYVIDLSTNSIQFVDEADNPDWNPKLNF